MSMFFSRICDGKGNLLISTKDFALAKDAFYNAYNPMNGPCQFFVGGYMDDLAPFLPMEYPSIPKHSD